MRIFCVIRALEIRMTGVSTPGIIYREWKLQSFIIRLPDLYHALGGLQKKIIQYYNKYQNENWTGALL